MSRGTRSACEVEFPKLLARRDDVDLFDVALEISRDLDPRVDPPACRDWVEARAAELRTDVARAVDETEALRQLASGLCGRHGLAGTSDAYGSIDGSLPHRIIETGRGIPLGLSLVYLAVAGRVGLDLVPVAAPSHFLLGCEGPEGALFVDAYGGGRVLTRRDCLEWLAGLSGLPASEIAPALRPADGKTVIARMLLNLKAVLVRDEDWAAVWAVQHRLVALNPTGYRERRDLAAVAVRAGRPGEAVDLIEACLTACPAAERPALTRLLSEARGLLCRLN